MDQRQKLERRETFEKLCHEHGLPITSQRRVILEEVLELDDHPGADEIYERVIRRLPGTSRTTVYRTLETLVSMGLIVKTCHAGRSIRYDRRTDLHHHLVCLRCNAIFDIDNSDLDSIRLPDTSVFGFDAFDYRVQIRGVCRDCRAKEEGS